LLKKYFSNSELLNYAVSQAPEYLYNKPRELQSGFNGSDVSVMYPEKYKIEVSHPNYYFFSNDFSISIETSEITVLMNEKGMKIRK